jgi:hypothetical protein
MPSTATDAMSWWRACWKPRTAAVVLGPKIPSISLSPIYVG